MPMSVSSPSCSLSRARFFSKVITPSIKGQTCPICLSHIHDHKAAVLTACCHAYCVDCIKKWSNLKRNCPLCKSQFDSWFCHINFSSNTFRIHKLPSLNDGKKVINRVRSRSHQIDLRRRENQSRPLPQMRTFGQPGSVPPKVVAERVLLWRASIYRRRLQAVPSSTSSRSSSLQNIFQNNVAKAKESVLQRIEPWIRRELEAILDDSEPSVIVHVVSSLFISSLEASSESLGAIDDFLEPLKPFLHEWTNMFWHELRCYAESSLNMETYDTVVKYKCLHLEHEEFQDK